MIYLKYYEALFRDIVKGIEFNENFENDVELVNNIFLNKYHKNINIKWNHSEIHDLIIRLEKRTPLISVSEFNNEFKITINKLFNNKFRYLENKSIELSKEKLKFCLKTDYFNLIIKLHIVKIYNDDAEIEIITIAPKYCTNIDFEINM